MIAPLSRVRERVGVRVCGGSCLKPTGCQGRANPHPALSRTRERVKDRVLSGPASDRRASPHVFLRGASSETTMVTPPVAKLDRSATVSLPAWLDNVLSILALLS